MCRWITLLSSSEPVNLSDLVLKAENSLVKMSFNAGYHPGFGPTNNSLFNGDGFGVGWYHDKMATGIVAELSRRERYERSNDMKPALFRDVLPAWSDSNLQEVCLACRSHCIVAHVRAASPGSVVSRENCHPFKCGRLLFCHNGRIDGFWGPLRKRILNGLTEHAYNVVRGTTDSEAAFGMILSELERSGQSLEQNDPYDPKALVDAIRRTIDKLADYQRVMDEERAIPRENCRNFSTLNFSLTDGVTMVTSRYCDKQPEIPAPSLYYAFDYADRLRDGITRGAGLRSTVGPGDGSGNVVASSISNIESCASALSTSTSAPPPPLKKSEFEEIVAQKMKRAPSYQDSLDNFNMAYDKFNEMPRDDLDKMAFCVSSDPLTFCDMWNPIPGNSIMWYKVGGLPELIELNGDNPESSTHTSILGDIATSSTSAGE